MLITESILQNVVGPTLIKDVQESQQELGLVASGRSAKSLTFTIERQGTKVTFRLLGLHYFEYQQRGRGSNAKPGKPSPTFVEVIRQWIQVKNKNIPLKAAYPIAYKIINKGVKVPNRFNKGGVLSIPLAEKRIKELLTKNLIPGYIDYIGSKLFKPL